MSHFVNYQMNLKNEKSLISAMEDLSYIVGKDQTINGWNGRTQRVEIAAKQGSKQHIGFNMQDGSYQAVADWMYIPSGERERIQQHYSKHEVMESLGESRFSVASVTEENGEIIIIGQRG